MIPSGSTLGVMGGGQLGRMFGIEARKMGYRLGVFNPAGDSPAGQVADFECTAAFTDEAALERFARDVAAVTFEFENIPATSLEALERGCPVRPRPEVLVVCQNREKEKTFLAAKGYPLAPFAVVDSGASLREALGRIGTPAVLKTAAFGYDGKGQKKIGPSDDPEDLWRGFEAPRAVLEKWIEHEREISVICAGSAESGYSCFPAAENVHTHHILDYSVVPARIAQETRREAESIARSLAADLDLCGVLAVEFFLAADGKLLVNELAPRPHNSGHFTFDACITSQFEQQVRTLCGLPLGSPRLLSPVVMVNLLGDLWPADDKPDWTPILNEPSAKLHLYGKGEARPGRKMGHFCVLDASPEKALEKALELREKLKVKS